MRRDRVRHGQPRRAQLAQQPPFAKRTRALRAEPEVVIVDEARDEAAAPIVAQHPRFVAVGDDEHFAAARGLDRDGAARAATRRRRTSLRSASRARSRGSEHEVPPVGYELLVGAHQRPSGAALGAQRVDGAQHGRGREVVQAAQVLERALAREARAAFDLERDDGGRIRERRRELRRRRAIDRDDGRAGRSRDVQQARVVADGHVGAPRADRRRPRATWRRTDCARARSPRAPRLRRRSTRSFAEPSTTTSAPALASAAAKRAVVCGGPALRGAVLRARHQAPRACAPASAHAPRAAARDCADRCASRGCNAAGSDRQACGSRGRPSATNRFTV